MAYISQSTQPEVCFCQQHACLTIITDAVFAVQVIDGSDILFLFGSVHEIKDIVAKNHDKLHDHQILVPVSQQGSMEEYQVCDWGD